MILDLGLAVRLVVGIRTHTAQRTAWQRTTKAEQAEGLAKWLTRQGKPDDVSRDWPLQQPPADWNPQQYPTPREDDAA